MQGNRSFGATIALIFLAVISLLPVDCKSDSYVFVIFEIHKGFFKRATNEKSSSMTFCIKHYENQARVFTDQHLVIILTHNIVCTYT